MPTVTRRRQQRLFGCLLHHVYQEQFAIVCLHNDVFSAEYSHYHRLPDISYPNLFVLQALRTLSVSNPKLNPTLILTLTPNSYTNINAYGNPRYLTRTLVSNAGYQTLVYEKVSVRNVWRPCSAMLPPGTQNVSLSAILSWPFCVSLSCNSLLSLEIVSAVDYLGH